jgi:macrodomain Ter protein organizer (MatP/YcbG family)
MDTPDNRCGKCGRAKEPTRQRSKLCRACDGAERARRAGRNTAMRRLTLDLPVDVWDRLDAEAQDHGQRIAGYLQQLTIKRDERKHGARP